MLDSTFTDQIHRETRELVSQPKLQAVRGCSPRMLLFCTLITAASALVTGYYHGQRMATATAPAGLTVMPTRVANECSNNAELEDILEPCYAKPGNFELPEIEIIFTET